MDLEHARLLFVYGTNEMSCSQAETYMLSGLRLQCRLLYPPLDKMRGWRDVRLTQEGIEFKSFVGPWRRLADDAWEYENVTRRWRLLE